MGRNIRVCSCAGCATHVHDPVHDWLVYEFAVDEGKHVSQWQGDTDRLSREISAAMWASATGTTTRQRAVAAYTNKQAFDRRLVKWKRDLASIALAFMGRQMSKTATERAIKKKLREIHTEAYRLGTRSAEGGGGLYRAQLTAADTKHVESIVRHEFRYLRKLLDAMIRGRERLPATADAGDWLGPGLSPVRRLANYAEAARSTFSSGRVLHLPGDVLLYWTISRGENCPDCLHLQRLSPFTPRTLPTTPRAGATRCLHNCRCRITVRQATVTKVAATARKNQSPEYVLRKLRQARRK